MDLSIQGLLSLEGIFTLGMLILLQAVLGFDNLLYISLESKRVEESQQSKVRKLGVGLAIVLRIVLLVVLLQAISMLTKPFFEYGFKPGAIAEAGETHEEEKSEVKTTPSDHGHPVKVNLEEQLTEGGKYFAGSFNFHSIIVLAGGIFIIYTAFKEIMHMLAIHDLGHTEKRKKQSVMKAVTWIVLMNLVFSFDSILSAIALTKNVWVMSIAIILSGSLMIWLADHVSEFLKKNRMYEVLGLFILFVVGIMLVSEGGHMAHLHVFSYPIHAMTKSTFYFVIGILVVVDVIQSRYQKKLIAMHEAEMKLDGQAAHS